MPTDLDLGPLIAEYVTATVQGEPNPVPMPMVGVEVHGRRGFSTIALIDTGSTGTALPVGMARGLGVELRPGPNTLAACGATGVEYQLADVPIRVWLAGREFTIEPWFADFPGMLLGRDVLQHFQILLDPRAGECVLNPYPLLED